jgi:hypothetical protein
MLAHRPYVICIAYSFSILIGVAEMQQCGINVTVAEMQQCGINVTVAEMQQCGRKTTMMGWWMVGKDGWGM